LFTPNKGQGRIRPNAGRQGGSPELRGPAMAFDLFLAATAVLAILGLGLFTWVFF
jgi:hypothetical protein